MAWNHANVRTPPAPSNCAGKSLEPSFRRANSPSGNHPVRNRSHLGAEWETLTKEVADAFQVFDRRPDALLARCKETPTVNIETPNGWATSNVSSGFEEMNASSLSAHYALCLDSSGRRWVSLWTRAVATGRAPEGDLACCATRRWSLYP